MANTVPPIPYKSVVVDDSGFLTPAWARFILSMFQRAGGNTALSNLELEELQNSDLSTVRSDVTVLQTTSTENTTNIATLQASVDGLNQGRAL